jgi:hypothetical protein
VNDLSLHLVHRFQYSTVIRGSESSRDIISGAYTQSLLLLGPWTLENLVSFCVIVTLVVFLGIPIKLSSFPQACTSLVATLKFT